MTYSVREVFLTLQGEGSRAGTKAVFVRFAGCNLWDGHPEHRDRGAGPCARWCDTDFFRGEKLELHELIERMDRLWPANPDVIRWCVLTGGEPSLQVDEALVAALDAAQWAVAVETNGTVDNPAVLRCDHVCLSPKRGTVWNKIKTADEVKVVLPGAATGEQGWRVDELADIEKFAENHGAYLYVQPQDGPDAAEHLRACVEWVQSHPRWRLSLQQHKLIGLP